jgi:hypothetical protein
VTTDSLVLSYLSERHSTGSLTHSDLDAALRGENGPAVAVWLTSQAELLGEVSNPAGLLRKHLDLPYIPDLCLRAVVAESMSPDEWRVLSRRAAAQLTTLAYTDYHQLYELETGIVESLIERFAGQPAPNDPDDPDAANAPIVMGLVCELAMRAGSNEVAGEPFSLYRNALWPQMTIQGLKGCWGYIQAVFDRYRPGERTDLVFQLVQARLRRNRLALAWVEANPNGVIRQNGDGGLPVQVWHNNRQYTPEHGSSVQFPVGSLVLFMTSANGSRYDEQTVGRITPFTLIWQRM